MALLTLVLAMAAGDLDLPRTLELEREFAPAAEAVPFWSLEPQAAAKPILSWSVGPRIGVASAFDSDDAAFLLGAQGRLTILPWLSVEASLDFQTDQSYESGDIDVFVFPIQFTALFYPPVDWIVRPYGVAGLGFYYTDIEYSGALAAKSDKSSFEVGIHLGFGGEYPITPTIVLDADLRFIFMSGGASGNDFDYFQLTFGVNFKIN